jgi:lysozyme
MPHYRTLNFSSRDHEKVSSEWFVLLWDLTHHDHLDYNVNEGHRTWARQQQLVDEQGVWSPSNPHGAARPSATAPHIKTGSPDHACDFDNVEGVIRAAKKRGVTLRQTVSTEAWHVEPDPSELHHYYKKNRRRVYRELAGKVVKHPVKHILPKRASDKLLAFIVRFEGERLEAYRVPGESFWTIGVGHTGKVHGKTIHEGMKISRGTSRKLLRKDLHSAEKAVLDLVPRRWRRRQKRFDAMVSMVFNMGAEILTAAPPLTSFGEVLKRRVNTVSIKAACDAIKLYNKGGVPLRTMPGLVKRRHAEAVLFKTGKYNG